ncbi:class I SAM-dependent methyltransferase [Streptomyces sp. NA04227]|uniref:class I SAM-dependent methyltransferase n=1 Tax=Streptomyces sp. NA04227 TaxID=2742136 RepID=UPI0020CA9388|nr:methyltransferase domain-containing protein [Streptomyces sp. NA04227]
MIGRSASAPYPSTSNSSRPNSSGPNAPTQNPTAPPSVRPGRPAPSALPAPTGAPSRSAAARRTECLAQLAFGTDHLRAERRTACPWCGGTRLRTRLRTGDLLGRRPGRFALDDCAACGHRFLNPPLARSGWDFYVRDFPVRGPEADRFGRLLTPAGTLRSRARSLLPYGEPEAWLDVETGTARLPVAAREVFPYTALDGVGVAGIRAALASGRIDAGFRGRLPALAPGLAGRYDALSMFHHLEQCPDPRAELRAARTVLRPGGHLVIECADPASLSGRLLGRWWAAHLQPRRQRLLPAAALCAELETLGFTVLATGRREAHIPCDLAAALALALAPLLPRDRAPWRRWIPSRAQLRLRKALLAATAPLISLARCADHLLAPLLARTPFANSYRIVARRGA